MPDQEREKYLKEISSLHAENATLKEEMALMHSQLDWFIKLMVRRKFEQSSVILEGEEQLSIMPDVKAILKSNILMPNTTGKISNHCNLKPRIGYSLSCSVVFFSLVI